MITGERSTIPWTLIHQLEHDYGSIKKASEYDETQEIFKKIQDQLNQCQSTTPKNSTRLIIHLIKQGYSVVETAAKTKRTIGHVRWVINNYGLVIMPIFKYQITDYTGRRYFFSNRKNLAVFDIPPTTEFVYAQNRISRKGGKLRRCRTHWVNLRPGDNYMLPSNNDSIFVK